MGALSINGRSLGGQVFEIKPGKQAEAQAAAKKDELDEVFFKANGKDYVAVAPSLEMDYGLSLSIAMGGSMAPKAEIKLDGKKTQVELIGADRDSLGQYRGLNEGVSAWKKSGLARTGLGTIVAAGGGFAAYKSGSWALSSAANFAQGGALNIAKGLGKAVGGGTGALLMGVAAVGGAALIYNGIHEYKRAGQFKEHEQTRLDNKVQSAPIYQFLGEKVK